VKIPYYHVDAFTSRRFAGNPAGVCVLQEWLPDEVLQNIAFENNLSETAFIVPQGDHYHLRWFTPATEVDLCGHATLATAFVVFHYLGYTQPAVHFQTQSGLLAVARQGDLLVMDFPARPPVACETPEALLRGLGRQPLEVQRSRDYFAVFATAAEVADLRPDFGELEKLDSLGVIVTAPDEQVDFVSRFFAPRVGIPEDPVTGSAHSTLIPYWSQRLSKKRLTALQLSARGGELFCEDAGERVKIGGRAVTYLQGEIEL
jgi:PhzF family phenazine biosynthesis protein